VVCIVFFVVAQDCTDLLNRPSLLLGMPASCSSRWRQEVLPCVQNGDQSREARTQDTKDRSLCARDEAYDGEEEGKATDQDAVITCWGYWAYFGSMAYMK